MGRALVTYRAARRATARLMHALNKNYPLREAFADAQPRWSNVPKVKDRPYQGDPKHHPHQGKRECARRVRQAEAKASHG